MKKACRVHCHLLPLLWLATSAVSQPDSLQYDLRGPATTSKALTAASSNGRSLLSAANSTRYTPPYNVCLFDWPPLVHCVDRLPEEYDGYSVALWKLIAQDLGWSDHEWFFTCMDSEDELLVDLADPEGNCTINGAGLELTWDNTKSDDFKFSWPVYKSGFSIMVTNPAHSSNLWVFAAPYRWTVWVLFGGSIFVVALLVTLAEVLTFGSKANRQGLQGWLWYVLGKQLHFTGQAPKTWASRVLVLGYGLLAMISLHLYTATLAGKIINERLEGQINSKSDLVGKRVGAWSDDVPLFRKYSIKADPFPWEDQDHVQEMLGTLRNHQFEALILDTPAVAHYTSTAPNCDLYPAGEPFDTFYVAIGFPGDAPDGLTLNVSASIVRLQTSQGTLDRLENEYIIGGTGGCQYTVGAARSSASYQIGLDQVRGLWLILGAVAGLCVVWAGIQALRHMKWSQNNLKQSKQPTEQGAADGGTVPEHKSPDKQKTVASGGAALVISKICDGVATPAKLEVDLPDRCDVEEIISPAALLPSDDGSTKVTVQAHNVRHHRLAEMHSTQETTAEPVALFNVRGTSSMQANNAISNINAISSQPGSS